MRKTLKSAGAAALAAATVVSGLSFGSAAAVAAPEATAKSAKASTKANVLTGQLKFNSNAIPGQPFSWTLMQSQRGTPVVGSGDGPEWSVPAVGETGRVQLVGSDKCLYRDGGAEYSGIGLFTCRDTDVYQWYMHQSSNGIGQLLTGKSSTLGIGVTYASNTLELHRRGGTEPEGVQLSALSSPVANGGFATAGVGFPATIPAPERRTVHFGASANASVTSMTNTTITVNAPSGSRFAAGQTSLTGEYKPAGGTWTSTTSLTMNGTVNAAGTQFTGTMVTPGSGFALHDGHQIRWGIDVVAGSTAGTQNMAFSGAGTTNHGAFSFSGNSAVTVTAAASEFTADVDSVDNAKREAVLVGLGTPGSQIKVNGKTIATVAQIGAWSGVVSGLSVGANTITVEQWDGSTKTDQRNVVVTIVDVLADGHGPDTVLDRGTGTNVFGHVTINEDFHSVKGGKVTFTAPEGTTFTADQDAIIGSYKSATGSWGETQRLKLSGGTLSSDGTKYTYDWSSDSGITFPKDGEIRWGISVETPAKGDAISDALRYNVTGDSNKGTFAAEGSTKTTAPAPVENGGFLADGIGRATTIVQGDEENVGFGLQADAATTLEGTTEVTVTAPSGTTFPSDLTKLTGAYKTAGGSWVTTPGLDVTGTVSDDGRTFTGTIAAGTAFAVESEARWTGKLAAAKDAAVGTRNLGFTVTGSTTHGSFSVEGNSKITIEKNDSVDLTARGAFDQDVAELATISGAAQGGAIVKLYDADGKVIATTTANGDDEYSFNVPAPTTGGKHEFTVTQTPSGSSESAPVAVELDYGQNSGLAVTSPEDGSTINDVRPTFTGTGTNGATIEIREAGVLVAKTTVKDGAWSVTASSNLDYAKHDMVVTQITKGNLRTQQDLSFTIEKAQEESPLTAKVDSVDDVARSAAISGHATPGAQIQRDGKVIATANGTTGAWSATVTDLKVGQNAVILDQFVGGVKKDSKTLDIEVKQTQFPFAVTSPENDSVVRTNDKQVTFTGTGKPGAKVSVNYGPRNIGTAYVDNDGEWKFTATMNYADYELTVYYKQNPTGAVTSQQPLHITVTNNEQNNPFVVTAPANDAVISAPDKQVTFEGTGTTGGIVTIKHGAKTVGTGTVNDNGQWKFTSTMNYADYDLTAYYKKTPTSGAVQQKLHIVVTDGAVVKPFEVTTPTDGSTVETADKQVTFSGEGAGNGLVKILRGSRVVAEGTVGTNGQWNLTGELNYGSYDVTVFHKPVGSKTADSKVLNLTIAPPAKDFEISTPSNGATVPGGPITFTGTGKDGGLVSAFLNSKKRAEGTVQGNTWTMTTAAITTPGTHTFTIYYKANPASQIADAYPVTITIK